MLPFELRGPGFILAVPTIDDVDRITELCQDPEILRWITAIDPPYTRTHAVEFVTQIAPELWASGRELIWAIRDPVDRRMAGVIGLRPGNGKAEVGFWLGREARGAGLMSRAVRLVAEYAFDPAGLGVTHLGWKAMVGNWASRRVAWATGFTFEGTSRGDLVKSGERRDAWTATLCAGEPMAPNSVWFDVPVLEGQRIMLRPFEDSDVDAVAEACGDPLSQHWLNGLPRPYTREHAANFLHRRREHAASGTAVHWAAAVPAGGPALGSFSLMNFGARDGGAEVGYWVHPAARGKSVASEAVSLLVGHAFAPITHGGLGLRRLVVAHADGNHASRKVIERTGFASMGRERRGDTIGDGSIVDLLWYDRLPAR
ncbi:GNAT family N-acetyltransferase [Antrihabitans sp. YC2-6]|uniref:GNAT family N-acetyltransferase n=1 Tax=Antrihabitans sp. YC2-6 TaxID=2799498 RepID=UPI0018F3DAED|nr:GNAT family N-acetyltransferase [Antrihabitans sp. YC2-6]MBJ8346127.1 GNAT family N-acetyltransferase [Antrihabitans sp. YC2-6]